MQKHLLSFFLLGLNITGATHLPEIFPYRENRSLRELLAIATFGCSFAFGEPHRTSCSPVRRPLFFISILLILFAIAHKICSLPLRGRIICPHLSLRDSSVRNGAFHFVKGLC